MSKLFDRIKGAGRGLRSDARRRSEPTRPLERRGPEPHGQQAGGQGNGGQSQHPNTYVQQRPSLGQGQPGGQGQQGQNPGQNLGQGQNQGQAGYQNVPRTGRAMPTDPHGRQEPQFSQNLPPRREQMQPPHVAQQPQGRPVEDNSGVSARQADGFGDVPASQPAPRPSEKAGQTGRGSKSAKGGMKDRASKAKSRFNKSIRNPTRKISVNAPIVEAGSVTGKSLTLVITIMCFLACLTAGAVYLINQSASAWLKDIASEVTIQIQPRENGDIAKRVTQVAFFLAKQRGIAGVRPLSTDESAKLLEPWLGQSGVLKELPVPRLIAIELDRQAPPNFTRLKAALAKSFPDATLDDHRRWQAQIRTVTRSMALGGLMILMLVGAATTAIIVSATRSAMASNKEIVEVLHFVGATDRFIAREFEKHFLSLGVKAGLVGAVSAMFVFFVMPWTMRALGGGIVTQSELRRLVGAGALDMPGYFLLGIVVIVIAALCMLTSRYGVFRILNSQS